MPEKKSSTPVSGKEPRTKYKVLVGLDYGDKRAEAGDVVDDLPTKSVEWLLESRCIEEVN